MAFVSMEVALLIDLLNLYRNSKQWSQSKFFFFLFLSFFPYQWNQVKFQNYSNSSWAFPHFEMVLLLKTIIGSSFKTKTKQKQKQKNQKSIPIFWMSVSAWQSARINSLTIEGSFPKSIGSVLQHNGNIVPKYLSNGVPIEFLFGFLFVFFCLHLVSWLLSSNWNYEEMKEGRPAISEWFRPMKFLKRKNSVGIIIIEK